VSGGLNALVLSLFVPVVDNSRAVHKGKAIGAVRINGPVAVVWPYLSKIERAARRTDAMVAGITFNVRSPAEPAIGARRSAETPRNRHCASVNIARP